MYIESGEGISFPIGGVHMNHSTQIVSADTKTRTLGEGSSLVFLPKSGVLLYACASSSVVALLLDATGNFELLPNVVKGEVLGIGSDVKVPFTHWTELGRLASWRPMVQSFFELFVLESRHVLVNRKCFV